MLRRPLPRPPVLDQDPSDQRVGDVARVLVAVGVVGAGVADDAVGDPRRLARSRSARYRRVAVDHARLVEDRYRLRPGRSRPRRVVGDETGRLLEIALPAAGWRASPATPPARPAPPAPASPPAASGLAAPPRPDSRVVVISPNTMRRWTTIDGSPSSRIVALTRSGPPTRSSSRFVALLSLTTIIIIARSRSVGCKPGPKSRRMPEPMTTSSARSVTRSSRSSVARLRLPEDLDQQRQLEDAGRRHRPLRVPPDLLPGRQIASRPARPRRPGPRWRRAPAPRAPACSIRFACQSTFASFHSAVIRTAVLRRAYCLRGQ